MKYLHAMARGRPWWRFMCVSRCYRKERGKKRNGTDGESCEDGGIPRQARCQMKLSKAGLHAGALELP